MNADEILLIRDIRRALDKLYIDYSRVEISVMRGHIMMTGTIRHLRAHPDVVLKDEMDTFQRRFSKDMRVKSLTMSARLVAQEKKEREHFGEAQPEEKVKKTTEAI